MFIQLNVCKVAYLSCVWIILNSLSSEAIYNILRWVLWEDSLWIPEIQLFCIVPYKGKLLRLSCIWHLELLLFNMKMSIILFIIWMQYDILAYLLTACGTPSCCRGCWGCCAWHTKVWCIIIQYIIKIKDLDDNMHCLNIKVMRIYIYI